MPELPEAETIARQLRSRLVGRRVRAVRVHRPDVIHAPAGRLARRLVGSALVEVARHGKRVALGFEGGWRLLVALGMTGTLQVRRRAATTREPLPPHTHLCLEFEGGVSLGFRDPRRFGGVWLLAEGEPLPGRGLGPDAEQVSWPVFRRLLGRRRQIKALLLDQGCLAGLGNIYADEALYRAGVHPLTPACRLGPDRGRRLLRAIRQVLREAIRQGGSTISDYRDSDGRSGWFQVRLRVYGRAGQPCRSCGTPVRRLTAAGRGTHICPRCQRRVR